MLETSCVSERTSPTGSSPSTPSVFTIPVVVVENQVICTQDKDSAAEMISKESSASPSAKVEQIDHVDVKSISNQSKACDTVENHAFLETSDISPSLSTTGSRPSLVQLMDEKCERAEQLLRELHEIAHDSGAGSSPSSTHLSTQLSADHVPVVHTSTRSPQRPRAGTWQPGTPRAFSRTVKERCSLNSTKFTLPKPKLHQKTLIKLVTEEPLAVILCSPGVEREVSYKCLDSKDCPVTNEVLVLEATISCDSNNNSVRARVGNKGGGIYIVSFTLKEAGDYRIRVSSPNNSEIVVCTPVRCGAKSPNLSRLCVASRIPRPKTPVRRHNSLSLGNIGSRRKPSIDSEDSGFGKQTLCKAKSGDVNTRKKFASQEHVDVNHVTMETPLTPRAVGSTEELHQDQLDRIKNWITGCEYKPCHPDELVTTRHNTTLLSPVEGVRQQRSGSFSGDIVACWENTRIISPQGVCLHGDQLLVADGGAGCIHVLEKNSGRLLRSFGAKTLKRPMDLFLHGSELYVTDYDSASVKQLSMDGDLIREIGVGKLKAPKGVAVDSKDRIIVADSKAACLVVFKHDGAVLKRLGTGRRTSYSPAPSPTHSPAHSPALSPACSSGRQRSSSFSRDVASCLNCPQYLGVDGNTVIVSDYKADDLKVYDISSGELLTRIGGHGEGMGQFWGPSGLAVDVDGRILVADSKNCRLQVLEADYSFHAYVDTTGETLFSPQGLISLPGQQLIVSDSGNHCLKLFRYGDNAGVTNIDINISGVMWR